MRLLLLYHIHHQSLSVCYVYLMKYKSESIEKFKEFKNEAEKQTGKKIKILRSNRGGEYLCNEFLDYLKECGIIS